MAKLVKKPKFDPNMAIICTKRLKSNNKVYSPGEHLPKPQTDAQYRRLRSLYEMNFIKNVYYDEILQKNEVSADDLDNIYDRKTLKTICESLDIKPRRSLEETKEAIREARKNKN